VPLWADSRNQTFEDFVTPQPVKPGEALVLGIVGGWERWDNPIKGVRRTAIRLKRRNLPGVWVETVENHKLDLAMRLIERAFDFNADGRLEREEAAQARIVVYGQSLGGRAVLWLCRRLEPLGVPVRLAMLIDSFGPDDYVVPANVAEAANWFQREHIILKGASAIHPADPAKTKIIGNWRRSYKKHKYDDSDDTWAHRTFMRSHIQTEYDTGIWSKVEELTLSALGAKP
jgi:pimeloyl-ACP methyl ester carboxylesterase